MPSKPPTNCKFPSCPALVPPGELYCPEHRRKVDSDWHRDRETTHGRVYTKRWDRARRAFLAQHPLCEECKRQGRVEPATQVDHITPHGMNMDLFWDSENNWEALCRPCHSRKTARETNFTGNHRRQ